MAEEYFVNQPEYERIMRLITELGGLDLDELMQRMDALDQELEALNTWKETADTTLSTVSGDIDTLNSDIDAIESAETARNQWHDVLAWGNYYTANQTLLLADATTDFDFMIAIAGQNNGGAGNGYGFIFIPRGYFSNDTTITVPFYVGTTAHKVTMTFVDATHIKILSSTNSTMGIRIIIGKKRG